MGVVYRARDQRLRRDVAIKILTSEEVKSQRTRILSEARTASALNHPAIVTIYDIGEADETAFIVMELVAGQSLQELLVAGALEVSAVLRLGAAIAEALAVAHCAGVIHGDVKPHNIMIQADGRIKLLDFGIARRLLLETNTLTLGSQTRTMPGEIKIAGTIAYIAPEQLRGERPDARSDLYALGTLLYEMTSGLRPFLAPTTSALVHQILHDPPPPLPADSRIPVRLAQIVSSLLEKNPATRYASAADLHRDLSNILHDLELGKHLAKVTGGKTTVAVLPFSLLTPAGEDEYLSVALADAAINSLGLSAKLIVRPTSSVLKYAKTDAMVAGRELNVDVVVEGSIQKYGQKIRVAALARRVADQAIIVTARQESEMADLFGLQDRLAEALAQALGVASEGAQATEPPTENAVAYEYFLRAGERISRLNRWDMLTAVGMLESATRLDPKFADAWARLAEVYVMILGMFESSPKWARKAEQAIAKALQIEKANAEALSAKGQLLWTPAKRFANVPALKALNKALELHPGCHQAHLWRGLIFVHLGLYADARRGLMTALAANPQDARPLIFVGQLALFEAKYDEAHEYYVRALALDPANVWANIFFPTLPMYQGKPEQAVEKIRVGRQMLPGEPTLTSVEAMLWAHRGEFRKAEQVLDKALRGGKPLLHTHHMWHNAATVYALTGKPQKAIAWLRKCAGMGFPNYPLFGSDPHFKSLQNQAGYLRFMTELKSEFKRYRRAFGSESSETF